MREIIFRGKRLDNGEWAEGYLYEHEPELVGIVSENDVPEPSKWFIARTAFADWNMPRLAEFIEVDPYTVGQYTGLKDKNGKRIFEGDIVRCGTGRVCKVTFFISPGVSGFDLVPIGGFDAPPPHNWSLFADTEVIGNIHDNPELLKEEAQP